MPVISASFVNTDIMVKPPFLWIVKLRAGTPGPANGIVTPFYHTFAFLSSIMTHCGAIIKVLFLGVVML